MACGGCGRRHTPAPVDQSDPVSVLKGGYQYLNDRQIRARLEVYKKNYCKDCEKRYQCDFSLFLECKKGTNSNK
jgi:hypothetical protein